mgnify:CR=1 FL=1
MNKEELIKELEEIKTVSKGYLHEYLENDEEAKEHFPTISEYNNCVDQLDDLFEVRIYDLAWYNLSKSLLKRLKK